MRKEAVIKILVYCSWLLLAVAAVMDLFKNPYRSIVWAGSLALLLIFYFRIRAPPYVHLLLSLMFVLNTLGEIIFELYYVFIYYDKLLHLISPLIICILIYNLAKTKIKNKKLLVMFCIFATLSLAVGWEIFEYGFDKLFEGTVQDINFSVMQGVNLKTGGHFFGLGEVMSKIDDTMLDLICSVAGTLIFALGFWLRRPLFGAQKGRRARKK